MDMQLKRGLLEPCVLAVLNTGDSYGYKLVKDVSVCIHITESTLYPILKRLEGTGDLSVYSVEHRGRLRKYYRITEQGRRKLYAFQEDWVQLEAVNAFIRERMKGAEDDKS